ncbi:MAG: hypothetical protein Q7R41_20625, partial [Phycisphaerales bacterium]|nr:hypothetical protein [Phycisphaerales bacterium]
ETEAGVRLQVRTGTESHRERFGSWSGGFWLPECGYRPGLESLLAGEGVSAFCVDQTNSGADLDQLEPIETADGPLAVPIDWRTIARVWSDRGYPSDDAYRDYHASTINGMRPWANGGEPYVRELALSRLSRDETIHFRPLLNANTDFVRNDVLAILQGLVDEDRIDPSAIDDLFRDCDNLRTRESLRRGVESGAVSAAGIERLRQRYLLTWREVEVFVMYYLTPAVVGRMAGTSLRRTCADKLHVSENTVRAHIKSIRLKLDLPGEAGTVAVKEWLLATGITG